MESKIWSMEQSKAKQIVIKTFGQEKHDSLLIFGDCMFVVDREEWIELGKHLEKGSCVYTKYDDYKIDLWDLYREARQYEVDEKVLEFISKHGDETPLKYLRKGARQFKNKNNLELIMYKIALLIKISTDFQGKHGMTFENVCLSKHSSLNVDNFWIFRTWKLPTYPGDFQKCISENRERLKSFQFDEDRHYRYVLDAKDFWRILHFKGLIFRITIPDDVCLWDPKIFVQLEHIEKPKASFQSFLDPRPIKVEEMSNPKTIHDKKSVNLNYFMYHFLTSLNKDNHQRLLKEFFTDFTLNYQGSKPEGIAARFESCYIPYEKETPECGFGCYYVLENQENAQFEDLKGRDLEFFQEMTKAYKIITDFDDYVEDGIYLFDEWGTVCEKLENSDSEFGKCLNPETLKIIHQKRTEEDHKCHPDDDKDDKVIIFAFQKVRDRRILEGKQRNEIVTFDFSKLYPNLTLPSTK